MYKFTGIINFDKNSTNENNTIKNMASKLSILGEISTEFYVENKISLGCKKDISHNSNLIQHIMYDGTLYTILVEGNIYNLDEIKTDLIDFGYTFENTSPSEIILKAYICYGSTVWSKLNGTFSIVIWNNKSEELFLVHDHFGISPLFYAITNGVLIFASEIKSLLEYPELEIAIDTRSIGELFGLGPAHTSGFTAFRNIFELKPGNFMIFNKDRFYQKEYWKLESLPFRNSFAQTCDEITYLLKDSIEKQIQTSSPLGTMLSGGLDSSIITAYTSHFYEKNNLGRLKTFSVDYVDNAKNFIKNDFQPDSDAKYIDIMKSKYNTEHKNIMFDTQDLVNSLEASMLGRDCPGMADIDSSLLLFCQSLKPEIDIAISGECSDEIFAGYPWFFNENALTSNTFPWSLALSERQELLNKSFSNKLNLKDYISNQYENSLKNVEILETDSVQTAQRRKISYLTMNWFMQTLIVRANRMSSLAGVELRVPFCDYRLVQYMWNVPWELKALNGREKGLLRYIVKNILPSQIVDRKKSPYPKTHNPAYLIAVRDLLSNIVNNNSSPLLQLIDKNYVLNIIETNGENFSYPWYGQLMTGPQLMAYLIQINMWLEKYQPKILI